MSPLEIADEVARDLHSELCEALSDALLPLVVRGERLADHAITPALLDVHRHAGETLGDRVFLWLDAGEWPNGTEHIHQVQAVERETCTRLVARLHLVLHGISEMPQQWVDEASAALCRAFRARIDARFVGPAGGAA